jgi:hypothetical protein
MPNHVVVDGSNLATEGRSNPSLQQLREAVAAYKEEHPSALITIVVDATFGHRIDPTEVAAFDAAVSTNELVAPPAGAIGRGDAFVLSIANKVNATILTNDSYQEFHGQYDWLFDEGRMIGGKPVPHIGWVFVPRLPVRGPLSRKSTAEAKRKSKPKDVAADSGTVRVGSAEASKPMPVPTAPPPKATPTQPRQAAAAQRPAAAAAAAAPAGNAGNAKKAGVNDLLQFLTFVEQHPVGTSVNALVDHYSSHGAYVKIGDVMGYVPLRLMADPAPRSAREFMKIGEAVTLVVEKFVPEKRSVDLSIPGIGVAPLPVVAVDTKPAKKGRGRKAVAPAVPTEVAPPVAEPEQQERLSRRRKAAAAKAPIPAPVVEAVAPAPAKPAKQTRSKKAAPAVAPAVEPSPAAPPVKRAARGNARPAKDSSTKAALSNDAPKDADLPKKTAKKASTTKGATKKDTAKKDAAKKDTAKKDTAKKAGA